MQTVSTKIRTNIGILYKIRVNLSTQMLLILYHAFIQPYIQYYDIIWAAGSNYLLDRVFRTDKKLVRAIVFANWYAQMNNLLPEIFSH